MEEQVPAGALEELSEDECLSLLADAQVGRLAVVVNGRPVIFPVNYVLDGKIVVFRNDPGTKLTNASLDPVCFEVDAIDLDRREGWSVVVQGVGREFTGALDDASVRERALALTTWVTGEKGHWVRIVNPTITGRRIRHAPAGNASPSSS
jgi:nitroimidazol reductase NimA-like FMN-containing flavoprotein (pyridoxamine 5'-phosphate oxidase superfamily)